jgi:hypothetical protein
VPENFVRSVKTSSSKIFFAAKQTIQKQRRLGPENYMPRTSLSCHEPVYHAANQFKEEPRILLYK